MSVERTIRVAVTYRVCPKWRAPIFSRLADHPNIDLMVVHGQGIPGTKLINADDFTGIPHVEMKTFSFGLRSTGRGSTWVLSPTVIRHLRRFRPDVLLCEGGSNFFNNVLIYLFAWWTRTPTIWWTLGAIPGREYRGLSRVFRKLSEGMMRRSTVLLGYSSRARRYFEMCGSEQCQFVAVNCVDTDRVAERCDESRSHPNDVRGKLKIEGKKVLLFVGALTHVKNIQNLLHAFARVSKEFDDVALVVVGDGEARSKLEQLAEELSLPNTHFVGSVIDGVTDYFLAGDIFVLPGLGGLAISEAMAHGLPIVCTVADGCEEDLVVPERNGLIVPPDDVPSLAGALMRLLSEPALLAKMGAASSELIREKYNVHTYVKGILDAIECAHATRDST